MLGTAQHKEIKIPKLTEIMNLRNLLNVNECQAWSVQKAVLKHTKSCLRGKGTKCRQSKGDTFSLLSV